MCRIEMFYGRPQFETSRIKLDSSSSIFNYFCNLKLKLNKCEATQQVERFKSMSQSIKKHTQKPC